MRDFDTDTTGELDYGSGHAVEFQRLTRFKILEHRGLVVADGQAGWWAILGSNQ